MNDRTQAGEWDEAARHLVRAHGAAPDRLLSLGLPFNHLRSGQTAPLTHQEQEQAS